MKKFLLTHGDKKYTPLLDLVRSWNQRYADLHEFIYIEDNKTTPGVPDYFWEKYRLIVETMQTALDGDFIAFLDCDALIVKPALDLLMTLESRHSFHDYDVAASKYPDNNGFAGWNLGTIFINVNPRTRAHFKAMLERGAVPPEEWKKLGGNPSVGWEERRFAMDQARGVSTDEDDFRNQHDQGIEPLRILSLDSVWNYGHAVRPLGPQALQNAIILHPAEKPLEDKLWLIRHNMELTAKGQTLFDPMTVVPKGTVTYPPMNHDECMGC